jgi:outer membrane protein OmpA-like peptidoglycan-associated protein
MLFFSKVALAAICLISFGFSQQAEAQLFERAMKSIQRGAERAVEREAERRADRAVTETIECAVGDTACEQRKAREAQRSGSPSEQPGAQGTSVASQATANGGSAARANPGEGAWANYDFVPGDKVLFVEEFTSDRVGNFPRRLRFIEGNTEIVQLDGARALRVNSRGKFDVQLPQSLPERWTLEMDVFLSSFVNNFSVYVVDKSGKPLGEQEILVDAYSGTGIATFESLVRSGTQNIKSLQTEMRVLEKEFTPVRVFVDGGYVKVYVNEVRVANLPQGNLGRSELLRFDFSDVREQPIFLRRIHIAETERSLYDRLLADGRVQTQGIYFDPGKYELKPESTPTLTEIADALRQDSQMNLLVEGHTDNTGESEKNYELSERRAQAVFDYLILNEKISPQRLQFGGMGDSKPVADNSTPEGRQQNRRVELVVLR